jgi:hypothetical protein
MPSAQVASRGAVLALSSLIATTLAVAGFGASVVTFGASARATDAAASLVLRLPDVGNGYRVDSDSGCGRLGVENAPPQVRHLILTYWPTGCEMLFNRWWLDRGGPTKGARQIQSGAFVFPSVASATEAMRIAADFARYVLGDYGGFTPRAEPFALGDETKLFAVGRDFTVAWRRGAVLALLHVDGRTPALARQAALSLARVQQSRIERPTPVPPGANDDREVALEDPRLGVPVYWLGRRFDPGPALPALRLENAEGNYGPEECLWKAASIDYAGRRAGVVLELWKPKRWARFKRTKLCRANSWNSPCARKRVVSLPRGRAELFAGYAPREGTPAKPVPMSPSSRARVVASCPKRPRDDFVAHVYLPRVVVTINMPACRRCDTEGGRYESFRALTAVVRGLRPRRR